MRSECCRSTAKSARAVRLPLRLCESGGLCRGLRPGFRLAAALSGLDAYARKRGRDSARNIAQARACNKAALHLGSGELRAAQH